MMGMVGDKNTIGFDIGPYWASSKQQQHITIWVDNRRINPSDDVVYLPTFYTKLEQEVTRLQNNSFLRPEYEALKDQEIFDRLDTEEDRFHQVLYYDASVCSAVCFFVERHSGNTLLCAYLSFHDRSILLQNDLFGIQISKTELLDVLNEVKENLSSEWV